MNKATQAELDFKAAMAQWKIVQQETADHKKGVFIDTDTRQNGRVVPTRMEYVRENGELRVTRITQGTNVIYGRDSKGVCHTSQADVNAFSSTYAYKDLRNLTINSPTIISVLSNVPCR